MLSGKVIQAVDNFTVNSKNRFKKVVLKKVKFHKLKKEIFYKLKLKKF